MDRYFKAGFFKIAQGEETEISQPEEKEKDTIVTCMSNCTYSQNPERRCMLEGISLSMDEQSGTFACGQYTPAQETMGAGMAHEAQPQQQKKEPGLPGAPVQK